MSEQSLTLSISRFSRKVDNQPKIAALPWRQLASELTKPGPVRPTKDGPLWSPASYEPGKTRAKEHVTALCALVLDIDSGADPELAEPLLEALGGGPIAAALYGSYNHDRPHVDRVGDEPSAPARPRWRLVIPFATPCPAARWPSTWQAARSIARDAGVEIDDKCKDVSRPYYLPARQDEKQAHIGRVFEGPPLAWETLAERAPAPEPEPRSPARAPSLPLRSSGGGLAHRLADYLSALEGNIASAPKGQRYDTARDNARAGVRRVLAHPEAGISVETWRARCLDAARATGASDPERAVNAGIEFGIEEGPDPLEDRPNPNGPFERPAGLAHLEQEGDPFWSELGGSEPPQGAPGGDVSTQGSSDRPPERPNVWGSLERRALLEEDPGDPPTLLHYPGHCTATKRPMPCLLRGVVGIFAARGGAGKTRAALELAVSLATGRPWLGPEGMLVDKGCSGRVLGIFGETSADAIERRLYRIGQDLELRRPEREAVGERFHRLSTRGRALPLVDDKGRRTVAFDDLHRLLASSGDPWDLVIIDPLVLFGGADIEIDNASAGAFMSAVSTFTDERYGFPSVLLVHHMRKGGEGRDGIRGSSALLNGAGWNATIDRDEAQGPDGRVLSIEKANDAIELRLYLTKPKEGHGRLVAQDTGRRTTNGRATRGFNE